MFVKPKNELEMDSSDHVVRASEVPTRSVHGGSSSSPNPAIIGLVLEPTGYQNGYKAAGYLIFKDPLPAQNWPPKSWTKPSQPGGFTTEPPHPPNHCAVFNLLIPAGYHIMGANNGRCLKKQNVDLREGKKCYVFTRPGKERAILLLKKNHIPRLDFSFKIKYPLILHQITPPRVD
jgi:hypothetical protein